MTREETIEFCQGWGIDWRECAPDDPMGAGMLFHWKNPRNGDDGECSHLTFEGLARLTGQELRRVILNGRDVRHVTRVVGYFSNVENWNKSKLAELKDRQRGTYSVGG